MIAPTRQQDRHGLIDFWCMRQCVQYNWNRSTMPAMHVWWRRVKAYLLHNQKLVGWLRLQQPPDHRAALSSQPAPCEGITVHGFHFWQNRCSRTTSIDISFAKKRLICQSLEAGVPKPMREPKKKAKKVPWYFTLLGVWCRICFLLHFDFPGQGPVNKLLAMKCVLNLRIQGF